MAQDPIYIPVGEAEYAFGTSAHGWEAFSVVNFHGVEEISRPFRYEVTLVRHAEHGQVALESLIGDDATLAIASRGAPLGPEGPTFRGAPLGPEGPTFRGAAGMFLRHGILEEAEEIERTRKIILYRVTLVPRVVRSRYRHRCRTFVESTLRRVISDVLRNVSPTHANGQDGLEEQTSDPVESELATAPLGPVRPNATFRWDVGDATASRLDDRSRLFNYVVQYNESDLDFVSRLLEEEGISYFFEHHPSGTVMWLTDNPGGASIYDEHRRDPREVRLQPSMGALDRNEEVVRSFREARRMRSRSVTMRDWHWPRSNMVLERSVPDGSARDDLAGHFEFPGRDENTLEAPCLHPAKVRFERLRAEQSLSEGTATLRAMQAGRRILLTDPSGGRGQALLLTRVETVATQLHFPETALDDIPFGFDGRTPRGGRSYLSRFAALRTDVPFRPAMRTPRPRIDGVQTAVVTDQDGDVRAPPEIHTDDWARVRVRFPWDQRDDGRPSSKWIRVSQHWAGAGFGALYIPRVGQEVLIAYYQGDPDRPAVVGRVYNQTNPLPLQQVGQRPERSTLRSHSTPNADGSNELRFDDRAGQEEIYLHAQHVLREVVEANHTTDVGGDQSNTVSGDQTIAVRGNQSTTVNGDQSNTVGGVQTITVGGDHQLTTVEHHQFNHVKGNRKHTVEMEELLTIRGDRSANFEANESRFVGRKRATEIVESDLLVVGTTRSVTTKQDDERVVLRNSMEHIDGQSEVTVAGARVVRAAGCTIEMRPGLLRLDNGAGAFITLTGGTIVVDAGSTLRARGRDNVSLSCDRLFSIDGEVVDVHGTPIKLNC